MKLLQLNKTVILTITLAPLIAACAHSRSHPEPAPAPPAAAPAAEPAAPAPLDPKLQMPLPYTFSRSGVAVQVNYVEFVGGQPQVNVSLRETRNQEASLLASTLMQARTDAGQPLAYTTYIREGQTQSDPALSLKPNERVMVTLTFQPPEVSTSSVHATLLQFPTGKWWSSANPSE